MRKLILIALAVGLTAVLAACGSNDENTDQPHGRDWQLTAITSKVPAFQGVILAAEQARYGIRFNDDETY